MDNKQTHGRPFRLRNYDYSQSGCYFVTFCTIHKSSILSQVISAGQGNASAVGRGLAPGSPALPMVYLSRIGSILKAQILALPERFPVVIHHYVVMPNHCHILLSIDEIEMPGASPRPTVHQIIGTCKSLTTRLANTADRTPGRVIFQTSFHDHIIRDENDFLIRWHYIDDNPAKWADDEYFCLS